VIMVDMTTKYPKKPARKFSPKLLFMVALMLAGKLSAQSPLAAQLEIFEVQQLESAGQVFEQLVEVRSVNPGTLLEYVLIYRNVSDQLLAGFEVRSPVPANTYFVAESIDINAEHQLEVSLDGGETWQQQPIMQAVIDDQGLEVMQVVPPAEYTDLRWRILSALSPQQQVQISYRVRVR
jgi:hypothetical protein